MVGILLLAHGGPNCVEDIPAFLHQVRGGRPCSQELVDEVQRKYRLIGGASPLPDITRRTAQKLQDACGLPAYVGMLHWQPFLEDAVPQMVRDGISKALVICLVPHFSESSVGRYRLRTASAASEQGLVFDFVDAWHDAPPYIEGLAASIVALREALGWDSGPRAHVIFSAHSLPRAAVQPDDPYERQLRETAEAVAAKLELPRGTWSVAFQSKSGSGQEWLGPSVEDRVRDLAEQGTVRVVLCPFGFLADQVEILYDLDVVMKRRAAELGVALARTPLLNDGPAVVESLALLVERWAA